MTSTLFDLSGKLPPDAEAALQQVAGILAQQRIPFFVVGALARDLLLEHAWHLPPQRATRDIDFGVRVADWLQFERLKNALRATGEFTPHPHQQQRLLHRNGVIIDVVPFGEIESPPGSIAWPDAEGVIMTTLGFAEAYAHAVKVLIGGNTAIAVCSPCGLALLKLITWDERRERKDASDLGTLLYYYLAVGNEARLFDEHIDLLDLPDHKLAGARMLGRDLNLLLTAQSRPLVEAILMRETTPGSRYQLAATMLAGCHFLDNDFERTLTLLEMLWQGISEARNP